VLYANRFDDIDKDNVARGPDGVPV